MAKELIAGVALLAGLAYVAKLKGENDSLQNQVTMLNSRVSSLSNEKADLQNTVRRKDSEIANLKEQLTKSKTK